ncbi:uncharacterized protein LOC126368294 [Pectinophora gossypiella]|uniref:uncharacterized protein LOC126368294 n=1 Tax=Pectinophora gossypiella TaxID=13191 RepID=UPI00214EED94|nr:uncharacterized protein LOC126368294 [Pectinophora gossypiella]
MSRLYRRSIDTIVTRLNALENRSVVDNTPAPPPAVTMDGTAEKIVEAIHSLKTDNSRSYYVSNFDPSIHDVDVWFGEVDRAKLNNRWDDYECVSRIGNCLKGDARVWLDMWVVNDRSWTNFKNDFKPLCARRVDMASILYEVMSTDSDHYQTYAEYARRSLLRLRIVKGLSDELISSIVIRGIRDPHVKASAVNANLLPNDLVNYLATFIKLPSKDRQNSRPVGYGNQLNFNNKPNNNLKRPFAKPHVPVKCYICGETGHKQVECTKKRKIDQSRAGPSTELNKSSNTPKSSSNVVCAYCKKDGHHISVCFAKQRSDANKQTNVNFCSTVNPHQSKDIVVGIVQGIPVDILIDSGAINASLISSSVVKHLSCAHKFTYREIKGVSASPITITSYITVTIELEDISIEVDLLIVPDEYMND